MKALKISLPDKPVLFVPAYDLCSILMWLVNYLDADNLSVTIETVDL